MNQFDHIRPYTNDEYKQNIDILFSNPRFLSVIGSMYPQAGAKEAVVNMMLKTKNIEELQEKVIFPLLLQIEKSSSKGITYSTMDQFHREEKYLYISNHRDIILDAAFLNAIMHKHGFRKTEVAIGDNLLIYDWIEKLVRLNRSFIVKRNLGVREQLTESKILSAYIRYALTVKGESVWLAQREGRTKDGNDTIQPALLKMLNMSNEGSLLEGFFELNIVPMAISYEIEPCGIFKVEELLKKKYDPEYAKTPQNDLESMAGGVTQQKGRIHFSFGNPLNYRLVELTGGKKDNEALQSIAEYIDKRIYFNYKLWPNNFIAYDELMKTGKHANKYTSSEKAEFISRMEKEASTLSFDMDEVVGLYLNMYANPVINFETHFG
jgi:hypothetical protein